MKRVGCLTTDWPPELDFSNPVLLTFSQSVPNLSARMAIQTARFFAVAEMSAVSIISRIRCKAAMVKNNKQKANDETQNCAAQARGKAKM